MLTSPGDVLGTFDSIADNLPDVNAMVTILPSTGPLDPLDPNRPGTVIVSYERAGDESDKSIFSNSTQATGWMGRMFNETLQRRARLLTCNSPLGYSGWTSGMGGFQGTKASAGATNYDAGFGGFAAGVDRIFSESGVVIRTGIAGGSLFGGVASGASSADLDTGFIGTYASLCGGGWLTSASASLGFSGYDIDRAILIPGSAPLISQGDADGGSFVMSLTSSYNLADGIVIDGDRALRFAPIVGLDYLHARRGGFTETDSGLLGLDVGGANFDAGLASVGIEMGTQYVSARGVGVQNLFDVRYQNLFGDDQVFSSSTLTNVGGPAFNSPGAREARNRILIGMGIGARMSQLMSLDFRYDTSLSSRSVNHQGSAGITLQL